MNDKELTKYTKITDPHYFRNIFTVLLSSFIYLCKTCFYMCSLAIQLWYQQYNYMYLDSTMFIYYVQNILLVYIIFKYDQIVLHVVVASFLSCIVLCHVYRNPDREKLLLINRRLMKKTHALFGVFIACK